MYMIVCILDSLFAVVCRSSTQLEAMDCYIETRACDATTANCQLRQVCILISLMAHYGLTFTVL